MSLTLDYLNNLDGIKELINDNIARLTLELGGYGMLSTLKCVYQRITPIYKKEKPRKMGKVHPNMTKQCP